MSRFLSFLLPSFVFIFSCIFCLFFISSFLFVFRLYVFLSSRPSLFVFFSFPPSLSVFLFPAFHIFSFFTTTLFLVRSEVFTAVTMKNAVSWDMASCSSCVKRRFGGTYRLHLQSTKIRERESSVSR
jgi:hypothetical protein